MTVEDDINAPCTKCEYADYSPFARPCADCGFDWCNFKPRQMDVGIVLDDDGF